MSKIIILIKIVLIIFIFSCSSLNQNPNSEFSSVTSNNWENLSYQNYKPIYTLNGGNRKTHFLNIGKAQREKEFMALLKVLGNKQDLNKIAKPISKVDSVIYNATIETNNKIAELQKKISKIDLNSSSSHEEILNLLKEINDLKCERIDAINRFLNKKVNKILGDISFKTGESKLSEKGKKEIEKIILSIVQDIEEWKSYVNECNEKIFENDVFVVVIDASGYADGQGSLQNNLNLSQSRAIAVKEEIITQLKRIIKDKNINIVYEKIFAKGYGEELPPGVIQKGDDDPARRICLISSVIGPSSLIK